MELPTFFKVVILMIHMLKVQYMRQFTSKSSLSASICPEQNYSMNFIHFAALHFTIAQNAEVIINILPQPGEAKRPGHCAIHPAR
ncbi:hypothetical protein ACFTAO_27345 [Paenibacillus rhizoplanae]